MKKRSQTSFSLGATMEQLKDDLLGFILLFVFVIGWIDWAWIFGVENSRSYTWWALIRYFGEMFS